MNIKCRLLVILANRQAFGGPVPPDILLQAVPIENSELKTAEEELKELCSDHPFICEKEEGVVLDSSGYPELVRFAQQNCSKQTLVCLRHRRP